MRHQTAKPKDLTVVQRFIIGSFGLGFIASGVINVVRGRLHYLTYWHAPVFFPFLILIGVLILAVAFTRAKK
jgi:hypothetical protein